MVLLVLCIFSVSARLYIRLRIQKHFGIDDGIVLFGTACLIAAIAVILLYIDRMYMVEAFTYYGPEAEFTLDPIQNIYFFHDILITVLCLTWSVLVAVKFCFLVLFKKLVDRMQPMVTWWWFAAIFNAVVSVTGLVVGIAGCPHYGNSPEIGNVHARVVHLNQDGH